MKIFRFAFHREGIWILLLSIVPGLVGLVILLLLWFLRITE